jgi:hypothetical protein
VVKIEALKDADGDYWLPLTNGDRSRVTREGFVDVTVSPDMLAVSEYGPFTTVTIEIRELPDVSLCDGCLRDKHFCYQCDDAVEHGHRHEED